MALTAADLLQGGGNNTGGISVTNNPLGPTTGANGQVQGRQINLQGNTPSYNSRPSVNPVQGPQNTVLGKPPQYGGGSNFSLTPPNENLPGTDQSQLGLIDQQFNDYMSTLGGYENNINKQFGDSTALLGSQNQDTLSQLNTQEGNQRQGILNDQQSAELQAGQGQAQQETQLRQLLGDLQQRQAARESQFGNSSVTDANNEAFGKQAFQGINTIQQQRAGAEQQINTTTQKNLTGLQDFYNKSRLSITQGYQSSIQQLTSQRDDKLAAIGAERNQAASTKAQNSFAAWQDYLNQKRSLDLQTYQNAQALQSYAAQKQAELAQQFQVAKVTLNQTDLMGNGSTTSYNVPASQVNGGQDYSTGTGGGGEQSLQVGQDPNDPIGLNNI